jgi:hypothetical protein
MFHCFQPEQLLSYGTMVPAAGAVSASSQKMLKVFDHNEAKFIDKEDNRSYCV